MVTKLSLRIVDGSILDKKFLITGASGLVGLSVLKALSDLACTLNRTLNISVISRSKQLNKLNLPGIDLKLLNLDLLKTDEISGLGKFDYILHAASSADPAYFKKFQKETFLINSITTDLLMDQMSDGGNFVFLSSTELYSGTKDTICNEQSLGLTSPMHPRAGYIEGKRTGEMFLNWRAETGVRATSIRLSYTYGPILRKDDNRVINQFIESALKYGKIYLKDSGFARRPNLYARDAAEMILNVLFDSKKYLYNIASDQINSILDIAKIIANLTDSTVVESKSDVIFDSSAQMYSQIDISTYIVDFGRPNFTSLEDGLKKTLNFRKKLDFTEI
jgi:UDP-glucuronate decarboxylase